MIRFHAEKGPQNLNCVPSSPPPPGISDHVAPIHNLFCMPIRTFLPKFDVSFAEETPAKVHNDSSASFSC